MKKLFLIITILVSLTSCKSCTSSYASRKVGVQKVCPKCGESENIHTNYDWSKPDRPVEEYLCNECGTYFKPKENDKTRN